MEFIDLYWSLNRFGSSGEDIHLMRGRSSPVELLDGLRIFAKATPTSGLHDESVADFLGSHPNAECTFKPNYRGGLNPATHDYEGFGVKVNARTGVVSAGANPAPQPLYNFTVLATLVADKNDSASPRKQAFLRFHLHNHIARAWLTPHRLSVPKNIRPFLFSVYAQFDDQTIAELKGRDDVFSWSSDPPDHINDVGFLSFDDADTDGDPVNVEALLSAEFKDGSAGDVIARGVATCYTLPQEAQLIPNSAGYDKRDEVPNFIFLADGFKDGDESKFNSMIDHFITSLRQHGSFKPFDHLVGRMNFWKVFVPSVSRGIGTKYEVFGEPRARPVPVFPDEFDLENDSPTSEDDLNLDQWGPNQVRFYFGLPVLAHLGMSNSDIKTYWRQISRLPGALIDEVDGDLIDEWKLMGDRRIVEQSDTFIGMYYGVPTMAKARLDEDPNLLEIYFHRFERNNLNKFLLELQYKDENNVLHPIGSVWDWSTDPVSGEHRGKDYDNVVILLCANSGRAQNESGNLCTNVISESRDYIGIQPDASVNAGFPGGRAVKMTDLEASRLPADMPLMPGKSTLLHEIAHSLGLSDEYGEGGITKKSRLFQFTGTSNIRDDQESSNVQVKSDLVVTPGGDQLDADKVKWRWHRIVKSAVLAPLSPPAPAAITPDGSEYRIKLKPRQAALFARDDIVHLRRRKLGESILKDIEYSQISAPRYPFVTRSPELIVRLVDPTANEVVVEPVNAGALTGHDLVVDFPAESVLYKPLRAPRILDEFPAAGSSLELTAPNILGYIDSTGHPLHEQLDSDGNLALDFEAEQSPVLVSISTPLCAKKNRNIVGLYAGGRTYHHGIYHATGHCIMRNNHQVAEFCSVCKYILTDYIDPSLHHEVDRLIQIYYPFEIGD